MILLIAAGVYLLVEAILGYRRGLVKSVLLMISWIVSIVAAAFLTKEFAMNSDKLLEYSDMLADILGKMSEVAVLILLFVVLLIMCRIFFHIIIRFSGIFSDVPVVGKVNKIMGLVFGLLKGSIVLFGIFLIFAVYTNNDTYMDILWEQIPNVMNWITEAFKYVKMIKESLR